MLSKEKLGQINLQHHFYYRSHFRELGYETFKNHFFEELNDDFCGKKIHCTKPIGIFLFSKTFPMMQ